MFAIPFRYTVDPTKSTVTVSLTKMGWAKILFWSFAPLLAMVGVGEIMMAVENRRAEKDEYVPED